jgi:quinol monooxygenase YgiN
VGRREWFGLVARLAAAIGVQRAARTQRTAMYGLIGKITAAPGKRDELVAILLEGTGGMPGCLSYIVARDSADADGIWITEVWDSRESHGASLSLASVRAAIAKGRPLIAGFSNRVETTPAGGHGLPPSPA